MHVSFTPVSAPINIAESSFFVVGKLSRLFNVMLRDSMGMQMISLLLKDANSYRGIWDHLRRHSKL